MKAAIDDNILATDLADYLVDKGMAFRDAHRVVGEIVKDSLSAGVGIRVLDLPALRKHSDLFQKDALDALNVERSLERRNLYGGTGPEAVAEQLEKARLRLAEYTVFP